MIQSQRSQDRRGWPVAFSKPSGRLLLRWWWLPIGSGGRLAIGWQELGGPPVVKPSQFGYGTSTIRELIPFELGGTIDLAFASSGLQCHLEIPADWVRRTLARNAHEMNSAPMFQIDGPTQA